MAATPTPTTPSLAERLRLLAKKVKPVCDMSGKRLEELADAVEGKDTRAHWGTINAVDWVDPSGTASQFLGPMQSRGRLVWFELLRNLAVLAPILVFWLGLWNADSAYRRYRESLDPASVADAATTNILQIWLNPPPFVTPPSWWERFLNYFNLLHVAEIDVLVIVGILVVTFLVHIGAHVNEERDEREANKIEQDLHDAACQASVVLAQRWSMGAVATGFGEQLRHLENYGASIKSATSDFTGVLTGWRDQVTQLKTSSDGLVVTVNNFVNAGNELKTATSSLGAEINGLKTSTVDAATKLTTSAESQSAAAAALSTSATAMNVEVGSLKTAVTELKTTQATHGKSLKSFSDSSQKLETAVVTATAVLTTLETAVSGLDAATEALRNMGTTTAAWAGTLSDNTSKIAGAAATLERFANATDARLEAQQTSIDNLIAAVNTLSKAATGVAGSAETNAARINTVTNDLKSADERITEFSAAVDRARAKLDGPPRRSWLARLLGRDQDRAA